jgi:MAE_28990/MAE_18760-like HEPN
MFATLQAEVIDRVFRVQQFAAEACDVSKNPHSAIASKGIVFVQLYALYEYTVTGIVLAGLTELQSHGLQIRDLRAELLCIVLDREIKSASTAAADKRWLKRSELFSRIDSPGDIPILADHFPKDGSHFRADQLRTIWMLFGLACPVVPDPRCLGRIEEMVEHRNAIAHGRERADVIGRRYSDAEITLRINDAQELCLHLIASMQAHCAVAANVRR